MNRHVEQRLTGDQKRWRAQLRKWEEERIDVIWEGAHFHLEDRFGRVVDWSGRPMRVGVDGVWEPAPHELVAEPRECASCGEEFLPPRRDALYCSHRCRQRAYRQRV